MSVMEKSLPELGDIIRVVFKGWHGSSREDALSIMWDSKPYLLQPGQDSFIPFEAAALWFGDPRSSEKVKSNRDNRGLVGFIPDRATEVRRLRTKYGNEGGSDELVHMYPLVEVFSLEGDRITTVLDDPAGDTVTAAKPSVSDNTQLLAIVHKQQQTIDLLMSKVGLNNPDQPLVEVTPQLVEDDLDASPSQEAEFPPEDDGMKMAPTSEQATGERGGRPVSEPPIDWSSLAMKDE